MKVLKVLPLILCAALTLPQFSQAQSFSVKSYTLIVAGTSSLHDFESTVETADIKGSFNIKDQKLIGITGVVAKIPVKAIKSTKGKMMDNKTWAAFKYEKNPLITFALASASVNSQASTIDARGTLTMAGVTKSIDLVLTYKVTTDGDLKISGSKKIKMTDFKMEPPTAMMGTIKVGDEVEVRFDMLLTSESNTL